MSRELYIDTASVEELLAWNRRGVVCGVTTNQKIFLSEGSVDFRQRVEAICDIVPDVPVSVELTTRGAERMLAEAITYTTWRPNIVIKVPVTAEATGLQVINALSRAGRATNATLMMTAEQLILALVAGATYVSLFFNRARDAGEDPCLEIGRARRFIEAGGYKTKIIAGSIRRPKDVAEAFDAGADIVTVPPKILEGMLHHPKTEEAAREFDRAWQEFVSRSPAQSPIVLTSNGHRRRSAQPTSTGRTTR